MQKKKKNTNAAHKFLAPILNTGNYENLEIQVELS